VALISGMNETGPVLLLHGANIQSPGSNSIGLAEPVDGTLNISGTSGPINVAMAGHLVGTGTTPILSGCGTSPVLSATAGDLHGTITEGSTAAGCTLTFHVPFSTPPDCTVSSPTASSLAGYSVTTAALTPILCPRRRLLPFMMRQPFRPARTPGMHCTNSLPLARGRDAPPIESTGPQGHRGRMRTRLLSAPDALADYEVLEKLLFFGIPRRDTKPQARSLILQFSSLAACRPPGPMSRPG
jgi:hypothetical protein